jgi:hypothetical protein
MNIIIIKFLNLNKIINILKNIKEYYFIKIKIMIIIFPIYSILAFIKGVKIFIYDI